MGSETDLIDGLLLPVESGGGVEEGFERSHEDLVALDVFREDELRVEDGFSRMVVGVGSVVGDEGRVV